MEKIDLKKIGFTYVQSDGYSLEFMKTKRVIKLEETENQVKVAIVDENDNDTITYIESIHIPKKVVFNSISQADFVVLIGETTNFNVMPEQAIGETTNSNETPEQVKKNEEEKYNLDTIKPDSPVDDIVKSIFVMAISLDASDIHIEAQSDDIQIRYRIDGVLQISRQIKKSIFSSVSSLIKIRAKLNPMEQRLPQDGRMTVIAEGEDIDLRVSIIPTTNGESIVLRIFNKSAKLLKLNELGFDTNALERIQADVEQPNGLILLTGPTGSGKTTTLHALLETLPVNELKIITIEDPVEQLIPGINQVQINEEINLSFDGMLRRVLRQDPNVIMVGEIRDAVTAELALRSALTGHLILSTLHTNDSVSVIARLENMGLEPYLIATVLRCVVAQRLVRKVCTNCAIQNTVPQRILERMEKYKIDAGDTMLVSNPDGCEFCRKTGYRGRTVISEILQIDPEITEMIIQRKTASDIIRHAETAGMRSMAADALQKLANGVTTLYEIEREVML